MQRRFSTAKSCWFALRQLCPTAWLQVGDMLFALGAGLMAAARTPGQLIAGAVSPEAITMLQSIVCMPHCTWQCLHELHAQPTCGRQMHHPVSAATPQAPTTCQLRLSLYRTCPDRVPLPGAFTFTRSDELGVLLGRRAASVVHSATALLSQAAWAPLDQLTQAADCGCCLQQG